MIEFLICDFSIFLVVCSFTGMDLKPEAGRDMSSSGSQPGSGGAGMSNGGFEVVGMAMGMSPPSSNVGGTSLTDVSLEQALTRVQELVKENTELRGKRDYGHILIATRMREIRNSKM